MARQYLGQGKPTGKTYGGGGSGEFGKLTAKPEYTFMGQHQSAPNAKLKAEGGQGDAHDGKEMSRDATGWNLHGKAYEGPQNWVPENKGVVSHEDPSKP